MRNAHPTRDPTASTDRDAVSQTNHCIHGAHVGAKPTFTASKASSCSRSFQTTLQKPNPASNKPFHLPKIRAPSPGNSVPPPASPHCGKARASARKRMICWLRCTSGSRKGLTRRICWRRKHCSKHLKDEPVPAWSLRECVQQWAMCHCETGQSYSRKFSTTLLNVGLKSIY